MVHMNSHVFFLLHREGTQKLILRLSEAAFKLYKIEGGQEENVCMYVCKIRHH